MLLILPCDGSTANAVGFVTRYSRPVVSEWLPAAGNLEAFPLVCQNDWMQDCAHERQDSLPGRHQ